MLSQKEIEVILQAREVAKRLNELLREDSLHRLRLYREYPYDPDGLKWTPDLHRRNVLAESLCKKLDSLIYHEEKTTLRRKEVSGLPLTHM